MKQSVFFFAIVGILACGGAFSQQTVVRKAAIVALTEDEELRVEFENGLATKARDSDYDATPSYEIVAELDDVDSRRFQQRMIEEGIGMVLMISPAAVGPGASLVSVRDSVSADVYRSIRRFAREISPSGEAEVFAVVHLAIYLIDEEGADLLSAGAVWLDEQAETRERSIELLQDLVIENVNAVRGPIREYLGMPPME